MTCGDSTLPEGPELTAGLRKLLEAKDCFVRAAMAAKDPARALQLDEAHARRAADPEPEP